VLIYSLTTGAQVVLLIVAVTFIVFALVVSMWVPRRKKDFPGDKKLSAFLTVTAALFIVQIGAVWWATGQEAEEHGDEAVATETAPAETTKTAPAETAPVETETAETETEATETETTETETTETETTETETTETETTETEPAEPAGDPAAGKAVFASAGCGGCHTLADSDAGGAIGPNLDESKPSYELVVDRVANGKGAMPAFGDQLSEEEIADVGAYVSTASGS
jgi:cytochrome c6